MCIFNHVISTVWFFCRYFIFSFHCKIRKSFAEPVGADNSVWLTLYSRFSDQVLCLKAAKESVEDSKPAEIPCHYYLIIYSIQIFGPKSDLSEPLRWLPHLDHAAVVSGEEKMPLNVKHGTVNVAQMPSQLLHQRCNALLVFKFSFYIIEVVNLLLLFLNEIFLAKQYCESLINQLPMISWES